MADLDRYLAVAQALAEETAAGLRAAWAGAVALRRKHDGSALTEADLSVEAIWRDRLARLCPDHGILGEEFGARPGRSAYTWVLDPIDGTRQFGAGLLNFASLIALCRDGQPVLGLIDLPLAGLRFVAAEGRGTRFGGLPVRCSDCTDLAAARIALANPDSFGPAERAGHARLQGAGRMRVFDGGSPAYGALARGQLDLCLNGGDLEPFDICALVPVVTEAGGSITDWQGRALGLDSRGAIVASASAELQAQALARLAAG